MKLGVRGKLLTTSVAIIVAALLLSGAYLSGELREREESRIQTELRRHARTAVVALTGVGNESIDSLGVIAGRLGTAAAARITIVAKDGRVLADSRLTDAETIALDNHGQRPEISQAMVAAEGAARRVSATIGLEMLYIAVRCDDCGRAVVIRAAMPLSEVDSVLSQLRTVLVVGAIVGVVFALAMSLLASQLLSSQLRRLVHSARAVAGGEGARRVVGISADDEVGGIAGSLNRMAEELESTMSSLAEERGRLRAVLEGMGGALVAIDARSRIRLVNGMAMKLLGLSESSIGGTLLETGSGKQLAEIIATAHGGESATTEFQLPNTTRTVQATATPQPRANGCVLVLHDVTELRRLERVRRDFVANVSHELRTPVSVIRANAETLLDGASDDPEASQTLLRALDRHATRLSDLVADLLDLARLESGRAEMVRAAVAVAQCARRAAEVVDAAAQKKAIRIEVDVEESVVVEGSESALEQIFINLLDNAVKYSPEASRVSVCTRSGAKTVRIEVLDEGSGISPDDALRVFERFYRVDPGRSRELGGTGLGLSIVKHLAEAMGGGVGVDPNEPCGSIFWIALSQATPATRSAH